MYYLNQYPVSTMYQFDNPYLTQLRIIEQRQREYHRQLARQQINRAVENFLIDVAELALEQVIKKYPVASTIYEVGGAMLAAKQNRPVKFVFKTLMAVESASRI